jgi:hypothetical protein
MAAVRQCAILAAVGLLLLAIPLAAGSLQVRSAAVVLMGLLFLAIVLRCFLTQQERHAVVGRLSVLALPNLSRW